MSDQKGASGEKKLLCSICKQYVPASQYTSKQKKKKGKRKCPTCSQIVVPNTQQPKQNLRLLEKKGNETVKHVSADSVKRAQDRLGKNETMSPEADKYDVFLKWLKEGGAKFPNLVLKYYTVDYRGIHARKRLDNDECILDVPFKMLMTSDVAKASEIGQKIRNSGCQVRSSHSWLASYLLQEKYRPDSYWRPYLDILPVHYRNMPIFFDEEELKWLQGSFSLEMIANRKVSLKMEYDNICSYVPEFKRYHHLDFFWARLAVITRVFGFKVNNVKTDGLVPMADMLNHKRPNETTWTYDQGRGGFTITTTKRLLKGSQIFDSYGRKCNSRYFVNYGFSLENNEDNQVAMYFNLNQADPLYKYKAKLLGTYERRFQIPFEHKERVTKKCMSYLRIALATPQELKDLANQPDLEKVDPISTRSEVACLEEVARVAKKLLRTFTTTLDEDAEILKDKDKKLTMNIRNCVIMRRGEKEVLHAYIFLAKQARKALDMDIRQFKKFHSAQHKSRGHAPGFAWRLCNYFEDIWIPLLTGVKKELEEMNNSL